jgi:4-alpha-glucanotransferase
MPLGASSDSYDVWRERDLFASGVSGGAPPDGFFALGQDWGFPPLHPIQLREQGFRYEINAIRQLMRAASMVRIDHVMGLHRLFWVPRGFKPADGVYVRYPTEERFAILTLESHRTQTTIVGEDLGTVPTIVRREMNHHDLKRMYVMQFMFKPDPHKAIEPPLAGMVAHLNTHDTPTFRAFWDGLDLGIRRELNLLDDRRLEEERMARRRVRWALVNWLLDSGLIKLSEENDPVKIMEACYKYMASSPTGVVLINMEDLWLEPRPQNVPGTGHERPNWRRRAVRTLEDFTADPAINALLDEIDRRRKGE